MFFNILDFMQDNKAFCIHFDNEFWKVNRKI